MVWCRGEEGSVTCRRSQGVELERLQAFDLVGDKIYGAATGVADHKCISRLKVRQPCKIPLMPSTGVIAKR